jgi:replicative DNA helicase
MKRLPYNEPLERAVLGTVLLQGQLGELSSLRTDDFFAPAHQELWSTLQGLALDGKTLDVFTVHEQLRAADRLRLVGDLPGLNALVDEGVRYPSHYKDDTNLLNRHVASLRQLTRERVVIAAAQEILDRGLGVTQAPDGQAEELGEFAITKVMAATRRDDDGRLVGPRAMTRGFFERLSARSKGAQPVVETPWADLNDRLGGGLQPGELVVLAGRPSMGKTAIAVNIGMHAAIPKFRDLDREGRCLRPLQPTLLFSLEMGQALVVDRIFAGEGSVEGDRIRRPMRRASDGGWYGVLQEDDKSSLKAVAERVLGGAFYIDDRGGLTVAEIAAAIRRFRMDPQLFSSPEQVGLVIVDYVGLVRPMPGPKGRTREQEVAEISRVLKTVARDTNMAVICVSQLNRQVEGRKDHRPMMSDLRETGALEQDADVIGLVFREEYYHTADTDQATRDRTRGLAELDICKQRNGPTGVVELLWRKAFTRFDAFDRRKD